MTKKKKLLIVSVSAGAGHVQAARAIEETAKAQYEKEYIVEYVDLMDYVSPALKKAIVDAYGFIIKNAPNVWQYIYKKTDNADRLKRTDSLMKRVNQLTARRFYTLLDSFQPDHIVCTHSFPAQVVQQSKNREHHYIPISLVVTDYGWHSYWILQDISNYFVATEKMKWEMMYHKIPTPVYVTGIPVRPVFFEKKSTEQLKKKYNISLKEKVILVLSGGQGLGASDEVVKYIDSHNAFDGARVIVVAGSNKILFNKLKKLEDKMKHIHLGVVGWTEDMDEYMRMADVIVSKPGGSTTSECMVLQKPLIAMNPIPGQEECNAFHIVEHDFGYRAGSIEDLLYYIEKVFKQKPKVFGDKKRIAAEEILKIINKNLD